MSKENLDFEALVANLTDIEVPKDNLDALIDASRDPIYGAILAQNFVNGTPLHAQEAVITRSIIGLLDRHSRQYTESKLKLQTDLAYGLPDRNAAANPESDYKPAQYVNEVYVRGVFIKLGKLATRDSETGETHNHIAVELKDPLLLNKFGEEVEGVPTPQLMVVPAGHISDYDILTQNS